MSYFYILLFGIPRIYSMSSHFGSITSKTICLKTRQEPGEQE